MSTPPPARQSADLAHAEKLHSLYCDWLQRESKDVLRMVQLGHPGAAGYRRLRDFFESLKYACNGGARLFTCAGPTEKSEYWTPDLQLSWYPSGRSLREFGHVYPAHASWTKYVEAAAHAHWPSGCEPRLWVGSWLVHTQDLELIAALTRVNPDAVRVHSSQGCQQLTFNGLHQGVSPEQIEACAQVLREFHREALLPKRTFEDDALDRAAVPLAHKTFHYANVTQVTVTDRHVLMPLLVLGGGDPAAHASLANRLAQLIDQGFPFEQARDWLEKFAPPDVLRRLTFQADTPRDRGQGERP
ncbi:hypothetical protein [Ramlibacter sp. AN1133]|uniref:hypothetical protein n=1 Tax=Ramlibacter sp. AN1133 TaxID=3133429 RepID=UPI0030C46395